MEWANQFGVFEVSLIIIFLFLYFLYVIYLLYKSKKYNLELSFFSIFFKLFLRFVYFSLIIISILGPSYGVLKKEIKTVSKDIFICVDLSESMLANDVSPNRLEKLKFELYKICSSFNSDRIGLIIFSSEAFVQCPLTYDQGALNLFIETLHTNLVPNSGTDFEPPLTLALNKLLNETDSKTSKQAKVILLISDGEHFGDDLKNVANDLDNNDIRLFTIGIGTEKGSKIPYRRGYKMKNGEPIITKLNSDDLKELANLTSGKYYEINNIRNESEILINDIKKIEGELRDTRKVDVGANKYFLFLLSALILIIFDVLLSLNIIKI